MHVARFPRLVRLIALIFLLGSIGELVGCSNNGTYEVHWTFDPNGKPLTAGDCGGHGVSELAIVSSNPGGLDRVIAPCAAGQFHHDLPAGSWTLVVSALDSNGLIKEPPGSPLLNAQATVSINDGQLTRVPAILPGADPMGSGSALYLPPEPECRDGVDNNHNGLVDLDDPGCAGDPNGPLE
jgi:hypothetical protein